MRGATTCAASLNDPAESGGPPPGRRYAGLSRQRQARESSTEAEVDASSAISTQRIACDRWFPGYAKRAETRTSLCRRGRRPSFG
jgi:hypothetical protein